MIETVIFIIIVICCCLSCCGSLGSILNSAGNLFNPSQWISTLSTGIPKLFSGFTSNISNLTDGLFKSGISGVTDIGDSIGGTASDVGNEITSGGGLW